MDVKIQIDVAEINVYPGSQGSDRFIKHSLAYLTALVTEVVEATVTDPEKLAEMTQRLESHTEALKAALQGASATTTPDPAEGSS